MKYKWLYWLLAAFFIIHGIEEWFEQIYNADQSMLWLSHLLNIDRKTVFLIIEILWIGLVIRVGLTPSNRFNRISLWFVSILAILESQHLISTLYIHKYYPGTISASLVMLTGIVF